MDRKENPKEGSYTNYLFDKGIDKILKKIGEEATELVIAAKNPNPEEIKYEMSDFLYHAMVLMVERGITWDDITNELADRERELFYSTPGQRVLTVFGRAYDMVDISYALFCTPKGQLNRKSKRRYIDYE